MLQAGFEYLVYKLYVPFHLATMRCYIIRHCRYEYDLHYHCTSPRELCYNRIHGHLGEVISRFLPDGKEGKSLVSGWCLILCSRRSKNLCLQFTLTSWHFMFAVTSQNNHGFIHIHSCVFKVMWDYMHVACNYLPYLYLITNTRKLTNSFLKLMHVPPF